MKNASNNPVMKTSTLSESENIVLTPTEFASSIKFGNEGDRIRFLNLSRLPGRLNTQEAAWLLGFRRHDIPILVSYRLLQHLGTPARNSEKYFPAAQLERLSRDFGWLDMATASLTTYWKAQNETRPTRRPQSDPEHPITTLGQPEKIAKRRIE
jgi:hypothetical protein